MPYQTLPAVKPEDEPTLQLMFGDDFEVLAATACAQDGCRFYLGVRANGNFYFVAITHYEQQAQLVLDRRSREKPETTLFRQWQHWRGSHRCRNCTYSKEQKRGELCVQVAQPCAAS